MEQFHSKAPVSPSNGYAFPGIDKDKPSLFNEDAFNKPGSKDVYDSMSKDKLNKKGSNDIKNGKLPLGYEIEIDPQYLPKTGLQERFLKNRPIFKGTFTEHEHISLPPSPELAEIYKKKMEDPNVSERVVYDSMELSPYYDNSPTSDDKYFDESKYIHPVVTEQDKKPGAYAPEGYFKYRDTSQIFGVMRYYSDLKPYYKVRGEDDETLVFESRFESGNLKRVIQTGDYEYDLYLNPDVKTGTFTQWYFFRIQNTRKNRNYTFNISNYQKSDSLYNQGMLPLVYSRKDYEKYKKSWQRIGENVVYYQNPNKKKGSLLNYCMTFNMNS
jgi:hypothetical protein